MVDSKGVVEVEELLQKAGFLSEGETIELVLSRPYDEVEPLFDGLFEETFKYGQVGGLNSFSGFAIFAPFLIMSDVMFEISQTSNNLLVRSNAFAIRKKTTEYFVAVVSPYLLQFFKWDINRRKWSTLNDEYRIEFFQKIINELNEELHGRKEDMVKKYLYLFGEYVLTFLDRAVQEISSVPDLKLPNGMDFKVVYLMRQGLSDFLNKGALDEVVDSDMESSFKSVYVPIAKKYIEGLTDSRHRYYYLLVAFVEAQNEYKKFLTDSLMILNHDANNLLQILESFKIGNIRDVVDRVRSVLASVPHQLIKNTNEAHFHIIMQVLFKVLGARVMSEVSTNLGRIDMVLEFEERIYIIEFKMSDSIEAINQIFDRKYYEPYCTSGKKLFALGISFDNNEKNINEAFCMEEIVR